MPPDSKPLESEFVMDLPMVRVTLPEGLAAEHPVIQTEIGDVDLSRDHLLGSIDMIAEKYADAKHLGYRPARVDLITPARSAHGRFGAIAVYLGYKNKTDRGPSFYLLEAGTATGDAKMIYYSPTMAPIPRVTSYYLPTPFVTMSNTYSGGITMQPAPNEDEPDTLLVESRVPGAKDPYITVTVKYKRSPTMELPLPQELDRGRRGARVAHREHDGGLGGGFPAEGARRVRRGPVLEACPTLRHAPGAERSAPGGAALTAKGGPFAAPRLTRTRAWRAATRVENGSASRVHLTVIPGAGRRQQSDGDAAPGGAYRAIFPSRGATGAPSK